MPHRRPKSFCHQYGAHRAFRHCLVTAGIVAFFDISLALSCFWGIGLVIEHSLLLQKALLGGGGLILIYLAWQLLHAQVQTDTSAYSQPTLWQTATLAFTVTWFNPQAVIDGTLMLGAFRSSLPADTASLFISGVAAASCLWFFGLTGIFKTCCQNLRPSHMQWINRICAPLFLFTPSNCFIPLGRCCKNNEYTI